MLRFVPQPLLVRAGESQERPKRGEASRLIPLEGRLCYILAVALRNGYMRRLARVVALTLLAWTALDLANSNLCALDAASQPVSLRQTSDRLAASRADPGAPTFGADDCFCCSHCVDISHALTRPARIQLAHPAPELREFAPSGSGHTLYHPPQFS